jgi:hypothetical protein
VQPPRDLFHGIAAVPFPPSVAEILQRPLKVNDIDVRPNGYVFLPDVKYREILDSAFGPEGWKLEPTGPVGLEPVRV